MSDQHTAFVGSVPENYDKYLGPAVEEALREFFPEQRRPASTWIGVASLAVSEFLIEIEATAELE